MALPAEASACALYRRSVCVREREGECGREGEREIGEREMGERERERRAAGEAISALGRTALNHRRPPATEDRRFVYIKGRYIPSLLTSSAPSAAAFTALYISACIERSAANVIRQWWSRNSRPGLHTQRTPIAAI